MSHERDELAQIIKAEYTRAVDRRRVTDCFTAPADAIYAAGYRKPRTITTAEELGALDTGSVVRDETGDVLKLTHRGWLSTDDEDASYVVLPATVLYTPEES